MCHSEPAVPVCAPTQQHSAAGAETLMYAEILEPQDYLGPKSKQQVNG